MDSESRSIFVHPHALVESDKIGTGTKVWAFAHVMRGAVVGTNCKIGNAVFLEDGAVVGNRVTLKNNSLIWSGVTIEDDAFVGPNTVFTNDIWPRAHRDSTSEDWLETRVGKGASIGANSTIVAGAVIGRHAFVGAGSVVTKDVLDHELVVGNPARRTGWVCECGSKLDSSFACGACGRRYAPTATGLHEASNGE